MRKKRAFALAEVLVAALIVSISFAGVISAFMAARAYSLRANRRLMAANYARQFLNSNYDAVAANTWDTGVLRVPINNAVGLARPNYNVRYNCVAVGGREYRQVDALADYPGD